MNKARLRGTSPAAREGEETALWLAGVIGRLPSDPEVPSGTPGYNVYTTQKSHWLGWLQQAGSGTYPRSGGPQRPARDVYTRIVEPKMLLWLARAASLPTELVDAAEHDAAAARTMAAQSAAIRRRIPWERLAAALSARS